MFTYFVMDWFDKNLLSIWDISLLQMVRLGAQLARCGLVYCESHPISDCRCQADLITQKSLTGFLFLIP